MEDDDIREGLRSGDHSAFRILRDRHGLAMYGACFKVLRDHSAADDALQDAFALVFRKRRRVAEASSIRAYVLQIAHNAAVDIARKAQRRRDLDERHGQLDESAPTAADPPSLDGGRVEALRACLETVAEPTRTALLLFYQEGKPWKDIAQQFDLQVDTIRMRVKRAFEALLACMKARGVTP